MSLSCFYTLSFIIFIAVDKAGGRLYQVCNFYLRLNVLFET